MPRDEFDYCPTTPYGASKVRFEQIVRKMAGEEFDWVMVRPTSIWGPWFEIPYRIFFDAVELGRYVHPKGRAIRKSFGFVGNTVYQLDRLGYGNHESVRHRTLYLCDYDPLDVFTWAVMIARSFDRREPFQVPHFALRTLAKIGDAIEAVSRKHPPLTSFRLDNLMTEMVHDTHPLSTVAGPLPFTVEEGVAITTRWIQEERYG
jgi:nucleoside-diphosphate-sugar epimerase